MWIVEFRSVECDEDAHVALGVRETAVRGFALWQTAI
jgi:hypothetical protein